MRCLANEPHCCQARKKKKTGLSIVLECEAITFLCDNVHIILRKFYEIT